MLLALAIAGMTAASGGLPTDAPHRGWLLGAWPEDAPADLEGRPLSELLAERTRLRAEFKSYAPGVAMIVSGAVLTPAGALTALVGLLVAGALFSSSGGLGIGLMIAGGVVCLGGIALLIIGGRLRSDAAAANESSERQLENLDRHIERLEKAPPPAPPPQVHRLQRSGRCAHALAPA